MNVLNRGGEVRDGGRTSATFQSREDVGVNKISPQHTLDTLRLHESDTNRKAAKEGPLKPC